MINIQVPEDWSCSQDDKDLTCLSGEVTLNPNWIEFSWFLQEPDVQPRGPQGTKGPRVRQGDTSSFRA